MKRSALLIFGIFFLATLMIVLPQKAAHAQEPICLDAAGGVIPCPQPEEIPCGQPGGPACPPAPNEDSTDGGNQKPTSIPSTATATAIATNTPFPLAAFPTNTATNQPPGLTPEVTPLATLPPTSTPGVEPLTITSTQDNDGTTGGSWDEECSWATCWMSDLACWAEGGKGYGVEDSVGNTGYHCDLPAGSTSGNNLKQLGLATIILVVLIMILLPAIQKIREAAARNPRRSNNRRVEVKLVRNHEENGENESKVADDDQEGIYKLKDVIISSATPKEDDSGHPPGETSGRMPNNKNPELVKNKDDGEQGKSSVYRLFGDADGDTPPPPPPPPPPAKK